MGNNYCNREILKSYFKKGCTPTADQFAQLIDSVPNMEDDRVIKATDNDGICLFPTNESRTLATVFAHDPEQDRPHQLWRLTLDADSSLGICNGNGNRVMTIDKNQDITMSGTLKAAKYIDNDSKQRQLELEADGTWHDLPVESAIEVNPDMCRVYRISACYKNLRNGKYSTCEALASHSCGRMRKVLSPNKHWWGWSGHIKIRWRHRDGKLHLQIKDKGISNAAKTICCRLEPVWEI